MKRIVICLAILTVLMGLGIAQTICKAEGPVVSTINGASIRTDEPKGIRFGGIVTGNTENIVEYGILFANGITDISELVIENEEKEDTEVVKGYTNAVNENGEFYISMVDIPERAYLSTMTARAYIKTATGEYIYATNSTSRNYYEVAKTFYDEDPTNTTAKEVVDNSKLRILLHTGPSTYGHTDMVNEFTNDFSAYIGKTTTAANFFDISWSSEEKSLGYNFLTSSTYKAKWGWMLDYINNVRKQNRKNVIAKATGQAEARGEIHNFLNLNSANSYGCDYANRNDYISLLYINPTDFELPSLELNGYTLNGWYVEEDFSGNQITNVNRNIELYSKWEDCKIVTYHLNGGSTKYATRADLVNDFLNDFNNFGTKTTYTNICSYWKDENYKYVNFWKNEPMRAKWLWIWDEIKVGCKGQDMQYINGIIEGSSYSDYALQNVALYFEKISPTIWRDDKPEQYKNVYGDLASGDTSGNFTSLDDNSFRKYMTGDLYVDELDDDFTLITTMYKEGYTFDGWYLTSDFTGEKITSVSLGYHLYAKFNTFDTSVTYHLNGGSTKYATRADLVNDFLNDFNNFGTKTTYTNICSYWKDENYKYVNFWKDATMRAKWLWIWDEIKVGCKGQDMQYINGIIEGSSYSSYALQNVALYFEKISPTIWRDDKPEQYKNVYGDLASGDTSGDFTSLEDNSFRKYMTGDLYVDSIDDDFSIVTTVYKEGYTFDGWYSTSDFSGEKVTSATAGCDLYAKWVKNS